MAIHTNGPRAVRRQITLPADVDARLRRLAAQRHQSRSAIIAEAIRAMTEPSDQLEGMAPFAGAIRGGGPEPLARTVDDIIYGPSSSPAAAT